MISLTFDGCGGGTRTRDLRLMGPTSCQLLPPRNISSKKESNPRHAEYKTAALPTELLERIFTIKRLPNRQLALTYARDDYRCPPLPLHISFIQPSELSGMATSQPRNFSTLPRRIGGIRSFLIRPVSGHTILRRAVFAPRTREFHMRHTLEKNGRSDDERSDMAECFVQPHREGTWSFQAGSNHRLLSTNQPFFLLNYGSVYPVYSRKPT